MGAAAHSLQVEPKVSPFPIVCYLVGKTGMKKTKQTEDWSVTTYARRLFCTREIFVCFRLLCKLIATFVHRTKLIQLIRSMSFVPLMRPFIYTSVMIPILPENMLSFLEAPVPFVVGKNRRVK